MREKGPAPPPPPKAEGKGPVCASETPPGNRYIGCPTQAYAVFSN